MTVMFRRCGLIEIVLSVLLLIAQHGAVSEPVAAAMAEGIRGLSRSAAREWGVHGIRVNVLCPATLSPGASAWLASNPAEASRALEDLRDPYKNYNKTAVADLAKQTPHVDWRAMLDGYGLKAAGDVITASQPHLSRGLTSIVARMAVPPMKSPYATPTGANANGKVSRTHCGG